MGEVVFVGVRHHSPACARLVRAVIHAKRPRFVLVEGPCDMNGRMDELALPHALPIAVYGYRAEQGASRGSWCPFCAYSPEWVALEEARRAGSEALFVDLPAWDRAFEGVENRYGDGRLRASHALGELSARLGFENVDALWDHLFEQPMPEDELGERLARYFEAFRADEPAEPRDEAREAWMARWVAWAAREAEDRPVVVVCGGFHAPELARAWKTADAARPELARPGEGVRVGSYLVPYSFHRLDAFTGYQSGMPSPLFYQRVWDDGPSAAGEAMLYEAVRHLRERKQRVSPADAIAASTLAHGLGTIRGHAALTRIDVLDGLAGALVKDALDAPLPWTRRGTLLARTDPLLVEMVAAFSGDRVGRLAPGTPRPPLVDDAYAELAAVGVELELAPRVVPANLGAPAGLARSRVLHRLRILGIPGIALDRAALLRRGETDLVERWKVARVLEADPALIEAAMHGATLAAAAQGALEIRLGTSPSLAEVAAIVVDAARAGIVTLADRFLAEIEARCGTEPSLSVLGGAMASLFGLWHADALLGARHAESVGKILEAAYARGLWLMESVRGATAELDRGHVSALVVLRDVLRHGTSLSVDAARTAGVVARVARDPDAPAYLRGAAVGFAWSARAELGHDATLDEEAAARAVRAAPLATLGDLLGGLFALAREEVRTSPSLLAVVDQAICGMHRHDFLLCLPALRQAFGYFPPRERLAIADAVLARHGGDEPDALPTDLVRPAVRSELVAAGMRLDEAVAERARRYGLG